MLSVKRCDWISIDERAEEGEGGNGIKNQVW